MDISNIIAAFALLAAIGSLCIAMLSYRISMKAFSLAETEHDDKARGIRPYLIDSFSFEKDKRRYCEFAVSITNLSSTTKSFSNIELHMEYVLENDEYGKVISQAVTDIRPPNTPANYQKLGLPLNIPPKETVTGWITFLYPVGKGLNLRIDGYKVVGICEGGVVEIASTYLLRFMRNEKDEN